MAMTFCKKLEAMEGAGYEVTAGLQWKELQVLDTVLWIRTNFHDSGCSVLRSKRTMMMRLIALYTLLALLNKRRNKCNSSWRVISGDATW